MKVLISGSSGQLATSFIRRCYFLNISCVGFDIQDIDITNTHLIRNKIKEEGFDVFINCAAYNSVDRAESERDRVFVVNSLAVRRLSEICRDNGVFFVHFSSDYVFDGKKGSPYIESDEPNPLNVYGQSKLDGERAIQEILDKYLIFRLSWLFGEGKSNFLYKLNQWIKPDTLLRVADDEVSVPTYIEDVVSVVVLALEKNLTGLYHVTNSGFCSRFDWAKHYLMLTATKKEIVPASVDSFHLDAIRPKFSAMSNQRISDKLSVLIPDWRNAMIRFLG